MSDNLIILVEDNQDDYEAVYRGFASHDMNFTIQWYKNAKEAMEYFNTTLTEHFPRLIMLDLNMPGLDGRKMLEIIKSTPKIKAIPIIILTTSTDQKDVKQCYENGASTYIQKPVNFEDMKKICASLNDYWLDTAILPEYEPDKYSHH